MAAGFGLVHKAAVGSTMDEARAHVLAGNTQPGWFLADRQTGGRGRHGRTWISPPGNLYATLALTSPCDPAQAPELGFVAGVALHRAVASCTGLRHPDLAIKWPNDLLLGGAKVAGLLLEGLQAHGRFAVLIGFGVNVASAPAGMSYPTQALAAAAATPTPARLLRELSLSWIEAQARWSAGFVRTRAEWQALAHGLGADVRVRPPSGEVRGVMRGIDARGCLLLDTLAGQVTIDAGDLFFGG